MIAGTVLPTREAVVQLELVGTGGLRTTIEAVIDTGFTDYLALPLHLVGALGLDYLQTDRVFLADGSDIAVDQYEVEVVWDGTPRYVAVHCLEGTPLIGMSLLWDHLLMMQVRVNGSVSITAVP